MSHVLLEAQNRRSHSNESNQAIAGMFFPERQKQTRYPVYKSNLDRRHELQIDVANYIMNHEAETGYQTQRC